MTTAMFTPHMISFGIIPVREYKVSNQVGKGGKSEQDEKDLR
jgi:hypothetical protein